MTIDRQDKGGWASKAWLRALEKTGPIARNPDVTFPVLVQGLAAAFGPTPALLSEQECLTYSALTERLSRYARWAVEEGLGAGDVVGLLMQNCPDYMAIWLGLSRTGVVVALLNVNLAGASLACSIDIVAPKRIIVGADLADALIGVLPRLDRPVQCWVHGRTRHDFPSIQEAIRVLSGAPLPAGECRPPTLTDQALYIYTSGTTGLPKAAKVSHFRVMQWSHWFAGMMDTQPSDRMYNCLPMYHGTGGVVATGALLVNGGSVLIRPRFSANQFWDDVAEWNCTLFQYIGELCRYLLNAPPHPRETGHSLRLCCGNGLGADIWEKFQARFGIPRILEFYAATEGTFSLYNCEGKPGAIGRIPPFLAHRPHVAIVKFDAEAGNPVRDSDGHCIRCAANEAGEAIGSLAEGDPLSAGRFEGYTDRAATNEKLLRNVFANGDAWFRTGDLMRKDEHGYFYFVDRVGDTFRWKGENVSTTEVAAVILAFPSVSGAAVYGVTVPGAEGRAGMAAITIRPDFDLAAFRLHLIAHLPEYAHPLFLRVCDRIEQTGTFRLKKHDLALEGYDPGTAGDAVYFNERKRQAFVPFDPALRDRTVKEHSG